MESPQQILKRLKINSTSYIKACLDMHEWDSYKSIDIYKQEITNLAGVPCNLEFKNQKTAHLFFAYLVQETVKVLQTGLIPDMESIWTISQEKATTFMKQHPYSTTDYKTDNEEESETWQDRAKRLFIKHIDMNKKELITLVALEVNKSTAYVSMFFNTIRNEIGYIEKQKNVASLEEIDNLYKNNIHRSKNEIFELLKQSFDFSDSVTTNHFYRCKKLYGDCKEQVVVQSTKSKIDVFLTQFVDEKTLNKNVVCNKIMEQFEVSKQTASAYFYQFIKQHNIQTEKQ